MTHSQMTSDWRFGSRTSADEVVRGVDLNGKLMIVTGANTGIGYETARALASAGARVLFACRDPEKGKQATLRAQAAHPGCQAEASQLDLASFSSIDSFADRLGGEPVDTLICNAGLLSPRYQTSDGGIEQTVGISHVGHFLLTQRLLPSLLSGGAGRVVMVSSESHKTPRKLDFDRLPMSPDRYSSMVAYGQAKLCNVLFANELQRRHGDSGLTACSLHPGTMVTTDIGRTSVPVRVFMKLVSPFTKTPSQGAATSVLCATHEDASAIAGNYFSHCRPVKCTAESQDLETAGRLWELTESWIASARNEAT